MTVPRLTPVSYMVLGLIELAGEATPYQLKQVAAQSVGNFWTMQHAQIYTESERLAKAGLLAEEREETGRRRRTYALTDAGREALEAWRATPATEIGELRSPGLLQLFFGAEKGPLARAQLKTHTQTLAGYEALHESAGPWLPEGQRLALEAGIAHEREWLRFWQALIP
jgi:DNA-binding PadR family transcriptional regulator